MKTTQVRATVERKASDLPRFVVVPTSRLRSWDLHGTTVVEVRINNVAVGRRSLKHWGKNRDCWFIDLPEAVCRRANVDTGSRIVLDLTRAPDDLPVELAELLDSSPDARRSWESRTPGERRMLAEHVRAAKKPETRARRAVKALLN